MLRKLATRPAGVALIALVFAASVAAQSPIRRTGAIGRSASAQPSTDTKPIPENEEHIASIEEISQKYPANCDVAEAPMTGDVRYFPPFAPTDSIVDLWCKVQTFKSTEHIKFWLVTDEHSTPLLESSFVPDGTVHLNRERFMYSLVHSIETNNGGAYFWRATRNLGSFGIPSDAPEAPYQFYTGKLYMELKDVEIMGFRFMVSATFEPNPGLIPAHFSKTADYLHIPVSSYDVATRKTVPKEVGFPWILTTVTLYSTDQRIDAGGPEIRKGLVSKYGKWVKKNDVADPSPNDPAHHQTTISDGAILIGIHEGVVGRQPGNTSPAGTKYFQANYLPQNNGPLDKIGPGNLEFKKFITDATDRRKKAIQDQMKTKNPF